METKIKCDGYTLTVKGHTLTEVVVEPRTKQVVIPEGITKIGQYAFDSLHITSVILPESLLSLSKYSFCDCKDLKEVFIGSKVKRLLGWYFEPGLSLEDRLKKRTVIHIGSGVNFMDENFINSFDCYDVDDSNNTYTSIDGVLFSKDMRTLYSFPHKNTGIYTVPDTVEKLGNCAFRYSHLSTILLPASIKEIGQSCFSSAAQLTKIDIYYPGQSYTPSSQAVCLPPELRCIEGWSFYNCRRINSVVIPPKVESIKDHAFSRSGLKEVLMYSSTLKYIGYNAFDRCQLTQIEFPSSIVSIKGWAFYNNPLLEVELPINLKELEGSAFADCDKLKRITVAEGNKHMVAIGNFVFSKDLSKLLMADPTFKGDYTIPETVHEIADYAFEGSEISGVSIPGSVKKIGDSAFCCCSKLRKACLKDGIRSIGSYAFENTDLEEVYLPDSITNFGNGIFDKECLLMGPDSSTNWKYLEYLHNCHTTNGNQVSCKALNRWTKIKNLNELYIKARLEQALIKRGVRYFIITERKWEKGTIPRYRNAAFLRVKLYKDNKKFEAQIDRWCRKDNRFLVLILNENELYNK